MRSVDELTEQMGDVEAIVAYADGKRRDDDELFDRISAFVDRDPEAALVIGERLVRSSDPDRREIGVRLVGVAGVVDDYARRERALPLLRHALADTEVGPLSGAIVQLGHLDDVDSHDLILGQAEHADPVVRDAVATALPSVGLNERSLDALIVLMEDPDDDVRDWATFAVGSLSDFDDERVRSALLARMDDPNLDARLEAIAGLARRRDERVRPFLDAELAEPEHSWVFDKAVQDLDLGTDVPEDGWRSPRR